ncbi:hypothetical protein PM10SUCC1_14840 [Propionigenium maris DSM 9537]|uniref:Uncharacterized protein n=1 Tax=Propionigenium maris DSM 9537 TaxID=1123000 RepID=A0A9W6LNI7_9FUSO|nr:hypothetical protein [Propionigenium maris]GLI55970.1 hypothetical protein PM10SUCC1_14840 [Propionigenium maris DSM 9537]
MALPLIIPVALGVSMVGLAAVAYEESKKEYVSNFFDSLEDKLVHMSNEVTKFPRLAMIQKANMIYTATVKEVIIDWVNDKGEVQETVMPITPERSTNVFEEYRANMTEPAFEWRNKGFSIAKRKSSEGIQEDSIEVVFHNTNKKTADNVHKDYIVDPARVPSKYEIAVAEQKHFLSWLSDYTKKLATLNAALKLKNRFQVMDYDYSIHPATEGGSDYIFEWSGSMYQIDNTTGQKIIGTDKDLPYSPLEGQAKEDLVMSSSNVSATISNPNLVISNPTVSLNSGATVGITPGATVGVNGTVGVASDATVGINPEGLAEGVKGITQALELANQYDYTGEKTPAEGSVKGKEVAVNTAKLDVEYSIEDAGTYTDSEGTVIPLKKGYKQNILPSKVAEKNIEQHKDVLGENQANITLAEDYQFEQQRVDSKENIENTSVKDTIIPEELDDYKVHREIGKQFFSTEPEEVPDVPLEQ